MGTDWGGRRNRQEQVLEKTGKQKALNLTYMDSTKKHPLSTGGVKFGEKKEAKERRQQNVTTIAE